MWIEWSKVNPRPGSSVFPLGLGAHLPTDGIFEDVASGIRVIYKLLQPPPQVPWRQCILFCEATAFTFLPLNCVHKGQGASPINFRLQGWSGACRPQQSNTSAWPQLLRKVSACGSCLQCRCNPETGKKGHCSGLQVKNPTLNVGKCRSRLLGLLCIQHMLGVIWRKFPQMCIKNM